jgi:glutamine amidotransferase
MGSKVRNRLSLRGMKIGIVDYGLGNVGSVRSAFQRLGVRTVLTCVADELASADALVLPGVGAFPAAMEQIKSRGLDLVLHNLVKNDHKPLLGICLGMQILADSGEEYTECAGLGLIPGRVRKLEAQGRRKIPHVGWSGVSVLPAGESMFGRMALEDAYYFDHSFYFDAVPECRAATVSWDGDIVAAVAHGKVWGAQFHPEKSQNSGLRLLKAFCLSVDKEASK